MANTTSGIWTNRMEATYQRGIDRRGKTKKKAMSPVKGTDRKPPLRDESQCASHGPRHANDEGEDGHDDECHEGTGIN